MVILLIFVIAIAVMCALFIGKNLDYKTPIWFFNSFDDTNVAVIVFFAFAAGVVFALLCLLVGKILKDSREAEQQELAEEKKKKKAEKKLMKAEAKAAKTKKSEKKSDDKDELVEVIQNPGVNNE